MSDILIFKFGDALGDALGDAKSNLLVNIR